MFICLHVVHDCIHATLVNLSSCNRDCMVCKSKVFTIWPFLENGLLTPAIRMRIRGNAMLAGH